MATKTKWVGDPTHSEVAFKVKHLMISNVKGNFSEFSINALTDGDDFSNAEIEVTINTASVSTGVADRDGHLKSPDFFDSANFGTMTFVSKSLSGKGDDLKLEGNLTIRGVTKAVTLDVEFGGVMTDPWGNVKAGFNVEGKINRKDWGLTWNAALEAGGVLVADEVRINAEVELLKVKEN
ncbi:MAG TPA: YceI family protein [Bacteroidales bacterium]|nr:YceI family protein [Bacteroidales bacterium]